MKFLKKEVKKMKKFLGSKLFVALSTIITFVLTMVAGALLAITLTTKTYMHNGYTSSKLITEFQWTTAGGWWLLGIVLTFLTFLLASLVREKFRDKKD